tara:strand:- start:10 stop:486 length:477 start_codon:yes stop_codon:yes gene_type:complete
MSFTNDKDSDNYATDKHGWEIIKEYIPHNKKIYAPFYCDGKQKEYFKDMGFDIIHEDTDFFTNTYDYDIIVDNPPFSKKKEVCIRLKEIDKPFMLILPSNIIVLKWFQALFKNQIQIIIPHTRIGFTHLDSDKGGYTPPLGSFVYCYKMNLEKDLTFI